MRARDVVALNARCLLILTVVNLPLVLFLGGAYLVFVAICAAAVLVVGVPAGLVLARLLRGVRAERVHVAVFALVGAVLAWPVLLAVVAVIVGGGVEWEAAPGALVIAAAEGAVGAGGARWWSGRRPSRPRPRPSDEEVEDEAVARAVTE